MTALRKSIPVAVPDTRSPVQNSFISARFSSKIRPRCLNGTPHASNSRSYQPTAMPSVRRPPDMISMLAAVLASTAARRSGSTRMPVPSSTRSVCAVSSASVESDSRKGNGRPLPRNM